MHKSDNLYKLPCEHGGNVENGTLPISAFAEIQILVVSEKRKIDAVRITDRYKEN